jgi:acyl-phosphate glycerol 3-phosphate acyltransferase
VSPELVAALLVGVAYLIGAIPFGYLVAKAAAGVDIRTVGSGNIGATNVGRTLGFRFFVLVFLLDMAKGLCPTLGFPRLATALTGAPPLPELSVLVALAAIVGHNFPVYLGFKGGKGVATSLGALLALDPVAGFASAAGFGAALAVCRYVSLSSILGGLVFVAVHFLRVSAPWSREQRAMSLATVCLLVLLVVRHRKNLSRIATGVEPKVSLGRRRGGPPSGCISVALVLVLIAVVVCAAAGFALWRRAARPDVLTVGPLVLAESARAATGHQRAERVAFADGGTLLAVTCPRYNRLVLYRVTARDGLEPLRDLELTGKPVAVCPAGDRLYVLERPAGDRRHVERGWLEAFDLLGQPTGTKLAVGFYPDDLALSADGRLAFVLTSGRAEGDAVKPSPALDVYDLAAGARPHGRVTFDGPKDDPARLCLSASGRHAVVTLSGSEEAAAIDLGDLAHPRVIGRTPLARVEQPYVSRSAGDKVVMPVASGREGLAVRLPDVGECVVATIPRGSGLEVSRAEDGRSLGRLTLRAGTLGLGETRPLGLAFSPERWLIAVANRSGGVHLVAVRPRAQAVASRHTVGRAN